MHPAAARALFDGEVATLTQALAERRAWRLQVPEFPLIDCSFTQAHRTPLRIQLNCENWNDLPPAVTLHTAEGALITVPPVNPSSIFHPNPHPATNQFFICMRGTREYHTHPSHVGDPWEALRGQENYSLGGILTQIWNAWCKGSG